MAAILPRTPKSPLLFRFFNRTLTAALAALPEGLKSAQPVLVPAPNPFIPRYNPESGCWAPPKYSKRRQKELLKAAAAEGLEEWMPRAEGERVGGGKRARAKAFAAAVVEHETALEGGSEEIEVQGESMVVELSGQRSAIPPSVLAQTAEKIVGKVHEPATDTTPQPVTDPKAPFLWIGMPKPVFSHPTVYGHRTRDKWFKGHKWQREKEERRKEVQRNIETMDERIKDYHQNRVNRRISGRLGGRIPF